MSIPKASVILIIFLGFASLFLVPMAVAETSKDQAASALATAEATVASSYQAVLKAEESGANVSALVSRLNETAGLLSEAEVAYENGDFDGAVSKANQSVTVANGVLNDALTLTSSASAADGQRIFWSTFIYSLAWFAFVVVLLWVWVWFSRRYTKNTLKMKPEVT